MSDLMQQARERFEEWADGQGIVLHRHGAGKYGYERTVTATAWEAWQAALRAAPEWQPIETAPKDGTSVWAFNGEQAPMCYIAGEGYALWIWADQVLSDVDPSPEQPTHWMPLPSPPLAARPQEASDA